jgi:hypothetical protein
VQQDPDKVLRATKIAPYATTNSRFAPTLSFIPAAEFRALPVATLPHRRSPRRRRKRPRAQEAARILAAGLQPSHSRPLARIHARSHAFTPARTHLRTRAARPRRDARANGARARGRYGARGSLELFGVADHGKSAPVTKSFRYL